MLKEIIIKQQVHKELEKNGGTSYKNKVVFATIQADGDEEGEKELIKF